LFGVINFLQARGMDALAPPTHKATHSVNSFCYMQNCTFSFSVQLEDMKVEGESYKFPTRLPLVAKVHFSGSDKQPTLSPKHNSYTRYKNAWISKFKWDP